MTKRKTFLERVMPRDIIAVLVLLCGFGLLAYGMDGTVTAIMAAIVGYYFSKRVYEENRRR